MLFEAGEENKFKPALHKKGTSHISFSKIFFNSDKNLSPNVFFFSSNSAPKYIPHFSYDQDSLLS